MPRGSNERFCIYKAHPCLGQGHGGVQDVPERKTHSRVPPAEFSLLEVLGKTGFGKVSVQVLRRDNRAILPNYFGGGACHARGVLPSSTLYLLLHTHTAPCFEGSGELVEMLLVKHKFLFSNFSAPRFPGYGSNFFWKF